MSVANSAWYVPSVRDLDKNPAPDAQECAAMRKGYLTWLAAQRGLALPHGTVFGPEGAMKDKELLLPMPGYGAANEAVTMQTLDGAGNVITSAPAWLKPNGNIPWPVKAVHAVADMPAQQKAKKAPKRQPAKAASSTATVEMETGMSKAVMARMDALETMVRDLCAALSPSVGAGEAISPPVAHEDAPAAIAPCEPPTASFLDLIGEGNAPASDMQAAPADTAAQIADMAAYIERLEGELERTQWRASRVMAAYGKMRGGRRRQAGLARRSDLRAMDALAKAHEASQQQRAAMDRADAAEKLVAQLKPLTDMLDAMRQPEYVPADPSGVISGTPARRWPTKTKGRMAA